MDSEKLYSKLKNYLPNNLDLMRHLKVNACWEYIVTQSSTKEENPKLKYYLFKNDENKLEMFTENPGIKPDLILYFTEKAILNLTHDNPNAETYYARYREIMYNPKPEIEVDSKINKPRLKLYRLGYQNWQKDFKF